MGQNRTIPLYKDLLGRNLTNTHYNDLLGQNWLAHTTMTFWGEIELRFWTMTFGAKSNYSVEQWLLGQNRITLLNNDLLGQNWTTVNLLRQNLTNTCNNDLLGKIELRYWTMTFGAKSNCVIKQWLLGRNQTFSHRRSFLQLQLPDKMVKINWFWISNPWNNLCLRDIRVHWTWTPARNDERSAFYTLGWLRPPWRHENYVKLSGKHRTNILNIGHAHCI